MDQLTVTVIDADRNQSQELCARLQQLHYRVSVFDAVAGLEEHLEANPSAVVLLDTDTVPVDNAFFRVLKKRYPHIHILLVSRLSYHPGLEEAMASHIYACLAKPLDPEELLYWLKSIAENLSVKSILETGAEGLVPSES